jgi:hypothetical protein
MACYARNVSGYDIFIEEKIAPHAGGFELRKAEEVLQCNDELDMYAGELLVF